MSRQQFWEWFDYNLIYCHDSHSFVHRLFNRFNKGNLKHYTDAQNAAFSVIEEMQREFGEKLKKKEKK